MNYIFIPLEWIVGIGISCLLFGWGVAMWFLGRKKKKELKAARTAGCCEHGYDLSVSWFRCKKCKAKDKIDAAVVIEELQCGSGKQSPDPTTALTAERVAASTIDVVHHKNAERSEKAERFKLGDWIRHKWEGLGKIIEYDSTDINEMYWKVDYGRECAWWAHVDSIEPAFPRVGEWWQVRGTKTSTWYSAYKIYSGALGYSWKKWIKNGEARPVNFGKGYE